MARSRESRLPLQCGPAEAGAGWLCTPGGAVASASVDCVWWKGTTWAGVFVINPLSEQREGSPSVPVSPRRHGSL